MPVFLCFVLFMCACRGSCLCICICLYESLYVTWRSKEGGGCPGAEIVDWGEILELIPMEEQEVLLAAKICLFFLIFILLDRQISFFQVNLKYIKNFWIKCMICKPMENYVTTLLKEVTIVVWQFCQNT